MSLCPSSNVMGTVLVISCVKMHVNFWTKFIHFSSKDNSFSVLKESVCAAIFTLSGNSEKG